MTDILHISASPKGPLSNSERLAEAFLARYRALHPDHTVRRLNVFESALPAFGAVHALAKFAPIFGETMTAEQTDAWKTIRALIADFDRADKIVISCPMWNYTVPWAMKLYLDCINQPGITFSYDRERMSHFGLLKNRPVQLLLTRSSVPPGDYTDFQMPYLRYVLNGMGLNDIRAVCAWRTTQPTREARDAYVAAFAGEAEAAAAAF